MQEDYSPAAQATKRAAGKAAKAAGRKVLDKLKHYFILFLKWSAPLWAGFLLCLLFMAVLFMAISGQSEQQNTGYDRPSLNQEVEQYRELVTLYAEQYGIQDFVGVLLAMMQHESGGKGLDVMQCSECPLNTKYPQKPNSILEPEYSVQVGTQYFVSCLQQAECSSTEETDKLSLALQGYNFGGGYIGWAIQNYGGYTQQNALEFSQKKQAELGWSVYGDPYYVQHVLTYYSYQQTRGMVYPIPGYTAISSPYGMRELGGKQDMHSGTDFPAPLGTPIVAATDGVVIVSGYSNSYGWYIKIRHPNGYITLYAHSSELIAQLGDSVKQGVDVIALVGSTGNSTGTHCHFEVYDPQGQRIDPMTFLEKEKNE